MPVRYSLSLIVHNESGSNFIYHDSKSIGNKDEHGNTYQARELEDGTTHLVLKNFPSKEFLVQRLSKFSTDINYIDLEHYWIVSLKN